MGQWVVNVQLLIKSQQLDLTIQDHLTNKLDLVIQDLLTNKLDLTIQDLLTNKLDLIIQDLQIHLQDLMESIQVEEVGEERQVEEDKI